MIYEYGRNNSEKDNGSCTSIRVRSRATNKKWERRYSLHLIIEELPPVNYLIQKTKRSKPFISHIDKIKYWATDNPLKLWLPDQPNDDNKVNVLVSIDDDGVRSMANKDNSHSAAENNDISFDSVVCLK